MGARHRVGIGLSYRPARLHRLAEFIPWYRFLGSINVKKYGLRNVTGDQVAWWAGTIIQFVVPARHSTLLAESIPWNRLLGSLTFTNSGSDSSLFPVNPQFRLSRLFLSSSRAFFINNLFLLVIYYFIHSTISMHL
jgi:hypothetical protein